MLRPASRFLGPEYHLASIRMNRWATSALLAGSALAYWYSHRNVHAGLELLSFALPALVAPEEVETDYDPQRHMTLSRTDFFPWMTHDEAMQVVRIVKKEADKKAGGPPTKVGQSVTVGKGLNKLDLIARKRGVRIEWTFDRSKELVERAIKISKVKVEVLKDPSRNMQDVDPVNDIVVSPVGFLREEINIQDVDLIIDELGRANVLSQPVPLSFEGKDFIITPKRAGAHFVWTFRREEAEIVAAYFGFLLPPLESEEGLTLRSLRLFLGGPTGARAIESKVKMRFGKAPAKPTTVWVGEGSDRVPMFVRKIRKGGEWFVKVNDLPRLPAALELEGSFHFEVPAKRYRWRKRQILPSLVPGFSAYADAFLAGQDLSEATRKMPDHFSLKAGYYGELIFDESNGRRIYLATSPFPRGAEVDVEVVQWDGERQNLGAYFKVKKGKESIEVRMAPGGAFLEPVPETPIQAMHAYLRDMVTGRDLSLSTWLLMQKRFRKFEIQFGQDRVYYFPRLNGKKPYLYINPAKKGDRARMTVVMNDLSSLAAGVKLEALRESQLWDIRMHNSGSLFSSSLRGRREGGHGYEAFLCLIRTIRAVGLQKTDFSLFTPYLKPFRLRSHSRRVVFSELEPEGDVLLPNLKKNLWVYFDPIVNRGDPTREPYYRVRWRNESRVSHLAEGEHSLEILADRVPVRRNDGVWIKVGEEESGVGEGAAIGYRLVRPNDHLATVTSWLTENGEVQRLSANRFIQLVRQGRSNGAEHEVAEEFLRSLVHRLSQMSTRKSTFSQMKTLEWTDPQFRRWGAYSELLRKWQLFSVAQIELDAVKLAGYFLNEYAKRLNTGHPIELALFAAGEPVVPAQPGRITIEPVIMLAEPAAITPAVVHLLQTALQIIFYNLGISSAGAFRSQAILGADGNLLAQGADLGLLFRPMVAGHPLLLKGARARAIDSMIETGRGRMIWNQIMNRLLPETSVGRRKMPGWTRILDLYPMGWRKAVLPTIGLMWTMFGCASYGPPSPNGMSVLWIIGGLGAAIILPRLLRWVRSKIYGASRRSIIWAAA